MKNVVRSTKQSIAKVAPNSIYFPYVNTKSKVQGRKHQIHPCGDGLFRVEDENDTIIISERTRHSRYKRGIQTWIDYLAKQYNLSQLQVEPGSVFIDCGANIGELGFWARRNEMVYHAFEPEDTEARACDLNNFDGSEQTNRLGLWHEATELKFYSKAASADSSFIEIADYNSVKVLKTTTLDQYVEQHQIESIGVLKVEAEGAEPEVLQGAEQSLSRCRYVTVDCGRERGLEQRDTVRDVCNALYSHGFQMLDGDMIRLSILFENQAATNRVAA